MQQTHLTLGLISREYPPETHVGGIGTYTATAARLMADHGHTVHVFCNGPESVVLQDAGITLHRLRMEKHPLPESPWLFPYRKWFRRHLPNYLDALTWSRTVARALKTMGPSLHLDALEFPETNGEGAELSALPNAQTGHRICRIHTSWLAEYQTGGWESRLLLRLQRRACARAHRVVSPSRFMAEKYARANLGWKRPVEVSANPLRLWNAPMQWEEKNPRHLLFVGRIEHRKGLDLLVQALDSLGAQVQGLTLRVVGAQYPPQNAADAACQAIVKAALLRLRQNGCAVEVLGAVAHEDLPRHYDWAGISILPSRQDNFPYTALEALSRGCFVVASNAGGLPETLQGCRAAVFPSGNRDALTQIMRELIQSETLVREAWIPNAKAIGEHYHPEACYRRLLETYVGQGALEPSAVPRQ